MYMLLAAGYYNEYADNLIEYTYAFLKMASLRL